MNKNKDINKDINKNVNNNNPKDEKRNNDNSFNDDSWDFL